MLNPDSKYGILIDFDGTITMVDTLVYLLDRYGMHDWRKLDHHVEHGVMNEADTLKLQMASLRIEPEKAIEELLEVIPLREGFPEFLAVAKKQNIPVRIVSGGFVEIIEPYLRKYSVECEIFANRISQHEKQNGWQVAIPVVPIEGCRHSHCKCRSEEWLRGLGREVIFIGDGITDYCVAERANIIFALSGGALERKFLREKKPHFPYITFTDVMQQLGWY